MAQPEEAIVIAERKFAERPNWPIIRFLAQMGGERGLRILLESAQREVRTSVPGMIGRGLRKFADRDTLLARITEMMDASDTATRAAAAALGGWQPETAYEPLLAKLTDQPDEAVSNAALTALERHAHEAAGLDLLKYILDDNAMSSQLTRLLNLIDLVDPALLSESGGPLELDPILDALPPVFRTVLVPVIESRFKTLEREEGRADERAAAAY